MKDSLRSLIRQALREDIGSGDVTTRLLVSKPQRGEAVIVAKEAGVFCGGKIAVQVFRLHDRSLKVKLHVPEGASIQKGQKLLTLHGRTRSILAAERTVLNFLGHLSGVATLTRQYVNAVRGTRAKIYDTRKTTPLWRKLEKEAVKAGGGENHRFGLFDEVLVKDNHWAALPVIARARSARSNLQAPRLLRLRLERCLAMTKGRRIPVEIEVQNLKELASLLESFTPDRVLLDNFSVKELKRAVLFVQGFYKVLQARYKIRRRAPELEASGGINLQNVRAVAHTGVDRISVGRLTHSAPVLDLSLRLIKTS